MGIELGRFCRFPELRSLAADKMVAYVNSEITPEVRISTVLISRKVKEQEMIIETGKS